MEIFHIIIGSIATVFFLIRFKYTKLVYQLLLAIWTPLTFLTYVTDDQTFQLVLGIVQLVLFFLVLIFLFTARRKQMKEYIKQQEELEKAKKEQESVPVEEKADTDDEKIV